MQFDEQATYYDRRTGLGTAVVDAIVQALQCLLEPVKPGVLLDVGAGTGELGQRINALPLRYIGMDLSAGMLSMFRQRYLADEMLPGLVQSDGNRSWPFDDASINVFFSSRALHQLDRHHALQELKRLSVPGSAWLVLGRVVRDPQSVKAVMRREMHQILRRYGLKENSGQKHRKQLFETLCEQGAKAAPTVVAARWTRGNRPMDSIESWRGVDGIAGVDLAADTKDRVLGELIQRAEMLYTDLDQPVEAEECYQLHALQLPY